MDFVKGIQAEGFIDYDSITLIIKKFLINKLPPALKNPTMKEFEDLYNISFQCITFNFSLRKEMCLSGKTTPDLLLIDALRMTSNIPFVFQPFVYEKTKEIFRWLSNKQFPYQ